MVAIEGSEKYNKPKSVRLAEKVANLLAGCKDGNHRLEVIYENTQPPGASNVVRWCKNCGSVVVDVDFDGRTNPGQVMKLMGPEISRWVFGYIKATQK